MRDAIMATDQRQAPAGEALGMSRTWQSPRLAVLGEVCSLTEGGSNGMWEGAGNRPTCAGMANRMC